MTGTTTGSGLEHAIGADGLMSIRLGDGDVRLRGVDGETVRIRDAHDHDLAEMFAIELGEGSASLRATHDADLLGRLRRGRTPDLDIDVPRRATIVVETASADVEVDGMLGDQRYRTSSGDVTLRAASGRIAIEAVSGDVDIVSTGESEVVLRTVSGDVELRAGTVRSLRATTTSGDLKIAGRLVGPGPFGIETVSGDALLAPAGDLRIEVATMSGDLRSEVEGRAEGGRGRRSLAIGTGGPLLTFRSMSGDLRVVRPTPVGIPVEPRSIPEATTPVAMNGAIAMAYDDARLRILRSLERGELDVAEAGRRLEALDSGDPGDPVVSGAEAPDA